jgi:4'-phosphopantetheinyl transferase EntD
MGAYASKIMVGTEREPIWPQGFVGSISHAQGVAVAAAAQANHYQSLGIDIEGHTDFSTALLRRILSPAEFDHVTSLASKRTEWGRLYFSAKEAVYKCVWPLTRVRPRYTEVELRFDSDLRFELVAYGSLSGVVSRVSGKAYVGELSICCASIPQPLTASGD